MMRKFLLTLIFAILAIYAFAQVSITVNVPTAGGFSAALTAAGGNAATVTNLTVTGNINAADIQFMKTNMPLLAILDMESAQISGNKFPSSAFDGNKSLTSIKLPVSITAIGAFAFNNCSNIKGDLVIPNGITQIDYMAFNGCTGFTGNLVIPNSVITIGAFAFYGCTGFNGTLTLSTSLASIYASAFRYCSGLIGSLTIPNTVTLIDDYAFDNCKKLTGNLTIPSSLTSIGYAAFSNCSGFNGTLTIPNTVTTIEGSAFENCSSLTGSLVLPSTLRTISYYCFSKCKGLTGNLIIPSSVTTIESHAFWGCAGFTGALTIPNSVTKIDGGVFEDCTGFNGVLTIPNSITSLGYNVFKNCSGLTGTISIPPLLTKVEDGLFYNCSGLTGTITIPSNATLIGNSAFYKCTGLTGNLVIPNTVTSIESSAFEGCRGLTGNLTIPNSVTSIESYAFMNCPGFNGTLTLSNSVTTYNDRTFLYCSGLTGGIVFPSNVTSVGTLTFAGCTGLNGSLVLPSSITSIGERAFESCSGLTGNLNIPNTVTSIGNGAFEGCSKLTGNLVIPNSVTTIGDHAFWGCKGFTGSLTIPNSVTTIGSLAFCACSGLNGTLTLPNSITVLNDFVFSNCSGLTGTLTIPSTVTAIKEAAFQNCTGFTGTLTIPSAVTEIGDYSFGRCKFSGNLIIPNSVLSIGSNAFFDCTSFNGELVIPSSVTSLADYAFYNCNAINKITVAKTVPLPIGAHTFYEVNKTTCQLVVPYGTTAAYRAADYWKEFVNISEKIIVIFNSQGGSAISDKITNYNTTITAPSNPTKTGYTFGGWFKEAACTNAWNFTTDLVTTNTTLYAKWIVNVYAVTFNSQGGSAVTGTNANYNTTIAAPTAPTKTGYTFGGWYKEAACTNVWAFATDVITAATTLYAKWTINSYAVTFNSQGGSAVTGTTANYNATIAAPTAPTRTGYTFGGWYKETACTNAWVFASDVITGVTTLYAKWTINSYAVTFNSQGGSTVTGTTANYNTTIAAPTAPTRTGYTFVGWYKETACTNAWAFATDVITAATTLYAKWTINSYAVTFNSQGGSAVTGTTANYNATIAAPTAPTRTGYTFGGWYKETACTNAWVFASDVITGVTTLYAKWTINSYTVTFNSQGGSAIGNVSANYNSTISSPTPTKTGYTFVAWYKEVACTNVWNFATDRIIANTTLYAKWTINTYTVSFYSNGGSNVSDITVTYNSTFTAPTPPTKTGYTFAGWYKEAAFTNVWNFAIDKVTGNTTLHAKWTINSYIVSFNTNGGTAISSVTAVYDTQISEPPTPSKTGYTFVGWYTDAAFNNYFDYQVYYITSNLTLYAKWQINSYNIKFNSSGGTVIFDLKVDYNSTIPKPQDPEWYGYTFNGWYKESSFINPWNFATDKVINDLTLYAKWSIKTYNVIFNSQGGTSVANIIANHGSKIVEPTPPTRTGYTFKAWYKEPTNGFTWKFDMEVVTEETTLYAYWDINNYTVNFDSQGGTAVASVSAEFNTKIAAPISPARNGYTFVGWYKDAACTNAWIFSTDLVKTATTLYAKWTINSYLVTFNSQGGSPVDGIIANYNAAIIEPVAPQRRGYTFAGWYKDAACTSVWVFNTDVVTSSTTLFAKWVINSYTVSFNSQGGSVVAETIATYNSTIIAPTAPTKTGYTFAGWYKDAACANVWIFATDVVTAATTLYAKWIVNTYTVTFNSQGGSAVNNTTANYNTSISAPTPPTKSGYTFAGWYKDAACTNVWTFATDLVLDNTTLYAKWDIGSSINNISIEEFKLYPNPAADFVTVEGKNIKHATIIDLRGVVVRQIEFSGKEVNSINVNGLKTGDYLIYLKTSNNKVFTLKLLKL